MQINGMENECLISITLLEKDFRSLLCAQKLIENFSHFHNLCHIVISQFSLVG